MIHFKKTSLNRFTINIVVLALFMFSFMEDINAQTQIVDTDGDTKVQTEANPDEDIIRFKLAGVEKWVMRNSSLEPSNTGENVFVGYKAGNSNSTGEFNVFLGGHAGFLNTTGSYNTFTGDHTGRHNSSGHHNTFTGNQAGFVNSTGAYNSFHGLNAGYHNTIGHHNTFTGVAAGFSNITGNYNTFNGHRAGYQNFSGTFNTALGYNAGFNGTTWMNRTAIGYNAQNTASNQVRVGNSVVSSIGGFTNWTNISDGRMKKDVKENVAGLEFILKLRPVTYHLDMDAIASRLNMQDESRLAEAEALKGSMVQSGFIAQEVEITARELGYDFSGVDMPKNEQDFYGLRYAEFVVPLVKAVQEQHVMFASLEEKTLQQDSLYNLQNRLIEEQASQLKEQEVKIEELQSKVDALVAVIQGSGVNKQGTSIPSTGGERGISDENNMLLYQNVPNPFETSTSISYQLNHSGKVSLKIYNESGRPVASLVDTYQDSGTYKINWDATGYERGVYLYVLSQNGEELARKMMLIK